MDNFVNKLLAGPNVWNIATACVGLAVLAALATRKVSRRWREARGDYALALMNRSDAEEIARILSPKPASAHYLSGLVTLDGALQRWFGAGWSWRLFNASLLVAFILPIILFTFAWLFGASGRFGDVPVMPEIASLPERAGRLGAIIGCICALLLFGAKFESVLGALRRMASDVSGSVGWAAAQPMRRRSNPMVETSTGPLAIVGTALIAVIFALTFAVGVAVAFYLAATWSLTLAFVLGLAVMLALSFGQAFVAAFCAAGVGALFYALSVSDPAPGMHPAALVLFFLALPAPFAFALFLAGSTTLSLLGALTRPTQSRRAAPWTALMTAAIVVTAGVCAALFAALSGLAFEAVNQLLEARGLSPVNWREMVEAARGASPLEPMTWLPFGMLLCVAAPALLSVAFGLAAMAVAACPDRARAHAILARGERLTPDQRGEAARLLTRLDFLRAPMRVAVAAALLAGAVAIPRAGTAATADRLAASLFAAGDLPARN